MENRSREHGKLWLWLDERIGLKEIEKLARKKRCRCAGTRFGITLAG